jgi:hypothetical protein
LLDQLRSRVPVQVLVHDSQSGVPWEWVPFGQNKGWGIALTPLEASETGGGMALSFPNATERGADSPLHPRGWGVFL